MRGSRAQFRFQFATPVPGQVGPNAVSLRYGCRENLGLDVEAVSEAGENLVIGIVRGYGTLRSGGPSDYGAEHACTVRECEIARMREYSD